MWEVWESEKHMNRSPSDDGSHFWRSPAKALINPSVLSWMHEGSDSKQYKNIKPFSRPSPLGVGSAGS